MNTASIPTQVSMELINSETKEGLSDESTSIEQTIPFWKGRTPEIIQSISYAYNTVARNSNSGLWQLHKGSERYWIAEIKERKLMKRLIQEAPAECKNFYVLDIGAGDYQWGRALANYLNAKKSIPKDVTIHIIGIRGEENLEKVVTELGQCKLYEFGQFQIENLSDEFQKKGLQLTNKVDLVVSRYTFRHLVDPVGTFTQTYDLLRPKTGHLLIDRFHFLQENKKTHELDMKESIDLLGGTKIPFVAKDYSISFVINKPDDRPCHLHKQYLKTVNTQSLKNSNSLDIDSKIVTLFKKTNKNAPTDTPTDMTEDVTPKPWKAQYYGDKSLYEWLRQNGLLYKSDKVWGALLTKDLCKKSPPFHNAIAAGDEEAIAQCLKEGCDINESDYTGATPLHLAIKHNNYKLFSELLKRGAMIKLFARKVGTPLHLAVKHDFRGDFVKDLIEAGADVNINYSKKNSLSRAIKCKNLKAVELLLKAKAYVSYTNRKKIENDSFFSSVKNLLPKSLSELDRFDMIIYHIVKGNSVLLIYPGACSGRKFTNPNQLTKDSQFIKVTVYPETHLLDDKNYEEITDMIKCEDRLEYDIDQVPDLELKFGY